MDTKQNISSIRHFLKKRHWVSDVFAGMCLKVFYAVWAGHFPGVAQPSRTLSGSVATSIGSRPPSEGRSVLRSASHPWSDPVLLSWCGSVHGRLCLAGVGARRAGRVTYLRLSSPAPLLGGPVISDRSDLGWIGVFRPTNNTGETSAFYHALQLTRDSDETFNLSCRFPAPLPSPQAPFMFPPPQILSGKPVERPGPMYRP